ncbi:aldehyde dehydrogenase family protein [Segnochrobactrum spirostomi]|uniref:Aldehyde dehydrogenase n=1 Tax=Segnochrobactrum spirostomi TaxID=2608987 RepID=A0A6A7Y6R0_9HYPH|nr:aldehyde dehydrogenase family protein [Segnochrobactrum spirostomi]MQT15010.1 aldehyde dehydrogenase [Segnochrobactrum spirostomi]
MTDPVISFDPNTLSPRADHFIKGRRREGGEGAVPVHRPSDGVEIGRLHDAGETIVDEAVGAARDAFRTSGWASAHPLDRAAVLHRWAALVEARTEEIARLESATSTRPIADTLGRDVGRAAGAIRFFAESVDKIEGSVIATAAAANCMVVPEPYGVVASITAWNFPLINAVWKSAPALAAGNAVVLKPSELTPYTAIRIAELAVEAGLPAGLFNVVQGLGATTGSALVRHPDVRKISFTGSTGTGARIMADAAATGTKPLTLELGGKSPQLVLKDVRDLSPVALNVANGFLANAGQVCTAGSRLIVHRSMADELVSRVQALAAARTAGPTWQVETTLSPLVSERQAERIERMIAATVADGASIVSGGTRVSGRNAGAYFEPTILANVAETSVGFREEFFGPVLSVYTYEDEDEAIAMANHPLYALAASLYTDDARKALAIPKRLEAGTVWVNAHGRQPGYAHPQGGFNHSGFGREMGRAGLEGFLRHKTVWLSHG